ncbi:hypothetical protein [Polaribacter sp. IC073]|nr:hypothetical protein [Polaribacter sp. IC073]
MAKGDSGSGKYKFINLARKTKAAGRTLPSLDFGTNAVKGFV